MNLQECRRLLQHYAHHNPKSSTFALLAGTAFTFATFIVAVTARDERLAAAHYAKVSSSSIGDDNTQMSQHEAQLKAMIENAKQSTWRENLENAVDAQERFVLPNRDSSGEDVPEYVRRIDERSREMLEEDRSREKQKTTRFWR